MSMNVMWSIYATPGGIYARGTNPFGHDLVGYVWAAGGTEAVNKFAARENLDPTQLQY